MSDPYRYFRVEAGEILEQLQNELLALERGAASAEVVPRLLRLAHTLKGAARVVKQKEIADLSHAIEDLLVPIRDANAPVAAATIGAALERVDAMRAQLLTLAPRASSADGVSGKPIANAPEEPFWAGGPKLQDFDALMDGITELGVQLALIRHCRSELERASHLAELLSAQLAPRRGPQAGNPASAKARSLAEELQSVLESGGHELQARLEQAGRELGQVRDAAERLRLVPAELMWGSLERTARDAALSLGKNVLFEARGGEVRLEADLLGLVQRALMQAVRNAVAHGIEAPAERTAAGKAAGGCGRGRRGTT